MLGAVIIIDSTVILLKFRLNSRNRIKYSNETLVAPKNDQSSSIEVQPENDDIYVGGPAAFVYECSVQ